jgi:DNA replication and repair protein RecF
MTNGTDNPAVLPAASDGNVLRQLTLEQFRNYEHADIAFQPGLTVLLGPNGQGKTNILEAVHYLAFLRSFRTRQIRELIHFGADGFQLQGRLSGGGSGQLEEDRLSVSFGRERRLSRNRAPLEKASEFINQFFCVAFIPEDIELIKGPASERRRFLDMLTGQLDRGYLRDLHAYNHALKSRNAILRHFRQFDAASLDAYDRLLARHGTAVILHRRRTTALLAGCPEAASAALVNGRIGYDYQPGLPKPDSSAALAGRLEVADGGLTDNGVLEAAYFDMLVQNRPRDMREAVTLWGPHRDDLEVRLNGHALSAYGSEGQCRAAALWLRVAAARILRESAPAAAGTGLVLLVDDVLGELDGNRRAAFWDQIRGATQILFTCTALPPETEVVPAQCLHVAAGTVAP